MYFKQTWWDKYLPYRNEEFSMWVGDYHVTSKVYSRKYVISKNYRTLVDFGCGAASDYDGYKSVGYILDYTGIDSCKYLVNKNIERGIKMIHSDVQDTTLTDSSTEISYCRHVLEHQADFRPLLREMIRVARLEVLAIFFILPSDTEKISYHWSENIYHNTYSKNYIERFLRAHGKVKTFNWVAIDIVDPPPNCPHIEMALHLELASESVDPAEICSRDIEYRWFYLPKGNPEIALPPTAARRC